MTSEELNKRLDEGGYKVLSGFIPRNKDTEKLYQLEEKLAGVIEECATEQLKLAGYKPNKKEEDPYEQYRKEYFPKGITSVINQILNQFDQKSVVTAIMVWATTRKRFSGDFPEDARDLVLYLKEVYDKHPKIKQDDN